MPDVSLEELHLALAACGADAALSLERSVVFLLEATCPPGATPVAYLEPERPVAQARIALFRALGTRADDPALRPLHRFALWRVLPGVPAGALAPMLRHEFEHARRFERSGPAFFAADRLLRGLVGLDGSGYRELPSEREANAAAGRFARQRLDPAALGAVAASPLYADLLAEPQPPRETVEATLAALAGAEAAGQLALPQGYLEGVREACRRYRSPHPAPLRSARTPLVTVLEPAADGRWRA